MQVFVRKLTGRRKQIIKETNKQNIKLVIAASQKSLEVLVIDEKKREKHREKQKE